MADANAVITALGQQIAQAIVDRTIAQVELAETQGRLTQALADIATAQMQAADVQDAE